MKRRFLINIVLAFSILPALKMVIDYIRFNIGGDHNFFHGSFLEYERAMALYFFILLPITFAIFILLPYNAIILNKETLKPITKIFIFEVILLTFVGVIGSFNNIWIYPYWKNIFYALAFIPISILFSLAIHFFVDKRETNTKI